MGKVDEARAEAVDTARDYGMDEVDRSEGYSGGTDLGDVEKALGVFEDAVRADMAAAIWQAIRDGSNIDELPGILGIVCPDCGGEPGGHYVGERFIQNECDLCGRVGSE